MKWADLLKPPTDAEAADLQRDKLASRYGKRPTLPMTDDRWLRLPEWVRRNMVMIIGHKPTASDSTEQRAEKLAALLADDDYDSGHELPSTADEAEVVTSLDLDTFMHRPVLDLDMPAELLPSSTPEHFHLYIDKPMTLTKYAKLLHALADAGIIEEGYAAASIERGYTSARLPWVKKPEPTP